MEMLRELEIITNAEHLKRIFNSLKDITLTEYILNIHNKYDIYHEYLDNREIKSIDKLIFVEKEKYNVSDLEFNNPSIIVKLCEFNRMDIIEHIIKDVEVYDRLKELLAVTNNVETLKKIKGNSDLLVKTCYYGNSKMCEYLIEEYKDINVKCLYAALRSGKTEIIEMLMSGGVLNKKNGNLLDDMKEFCDRMGLYEMKIYLIYWELIQKPAKDKKEFLKQLDIDNPETKDIINKSLPYNYRELIMIMEMIIKEEYMEEYSLERLYEDKNRLTELVRFIVNNQIDNKLLIELSKKIIGGLDMYKRKLMMMRFITNDDEESLKFMNDNGLINEEIVMSIEKRYFKITTMNALTYLSNNYRNFLINNLNDMVRIWILLNYDMRTTKLVKNGIIEDEVIIDKLLERLDQLSEIYRKGMKISDDRINYLAKEDKIKDEDMIRFIIKNHELRIPKIYKMCMREMKNETNGILSMIGWK